jgi:hypothetical protein
MTGTPIDLSSRLSLRTAFAFPLQSRRARRELLIGAALLLIPVVGWLLNMGHRILMTHRMQHGLCAWPVWPGVRTREDWLAWAALLRHGVLTFLGMVEYHLPAAACLAMADLFAVRWLLWAGGALWVVGTLAVPGYMSHYCAGLDPREIFDPVRAMRRVWQGGVAYWHGWGIALAALCVSLGGLAILGFGFLVTSVWFWQVAGFSFATVFSGKFGLVRKADSSPPPADCPAALNEPSRARLARAGPAGSNSTESRETPAQGRDKPCVRSRPARPSCSPSSPPAP